MKKPVNLRCSLQGVLSVTSPLHVGDGKDSPRDRSDEGVNCTVLLDWRGRPYLPATTLRGFLREAWLERWRGDDGAEFRRLFGHQEQGGQLLVEDAFVEDDDDRGLGAVARTAVDSSSRTAASGSLRNMEVVEPGQRFLFKAAIAAAPDQGVEQVDLERFVALLRGVEWRLGGETGSGLGRLEWVGTEERHLLVTPATVKGWLSGDPGGTARPEAVGSPDRLESVPKPPRPARRRLTLDLTLEFSGPMRVGAPQAAEAPNNELHSLPADRPLPGSSFRGSLRAQTERILNTAFGDGRQPPKAVTTLEEVKEELTPLHKLFGHTGWRSILEVEDFKPDGHLNEHIQSIVAIDRFTGGVQEGPFYARGYWSPTLCGRMAIDLDRAEDCGLGRLWMPLLAFLLRDLIDGDVTFGWGAGRGYGRCTATVSVDSDKDREAATWTWLESLADPVSPGALPIDFAELWDELGKAWSTSAHAEQGAHDD